MQHNPDIPFEEALDNRAKKKKRFRDINSGRTRLREDG